MIQSIIKQDNFNKPRNKINHDLKDMNWLIDWQTETDRQPEPQKLTPEKINGWIDVIEPYTHTYSEICTILCHHLKGLNVLSRNGKYYVTFHWLLLGKFQWEFQKDQQNEREYSKRGRRKNTSVHWERGSLLESSLSCRWSQRLLHTVVWWHFWNASMKNLWSVSLSCFSPLEKP